MNLIVLIFGESSSGHPKNIAVSVLKYSVINNDNLLICSGCNMIHHVTAWTYYDILRPNFDLYYVVVYLHIFIHTGNKTQFIKSARDSSNVGLTSQSNPIWVLAGTARPRRVSCSISEVLSAIKLMIAVRQALIKGCSTGFDQRRWFMINIILKID